MCDKEIYLIDQLRAVQRDIDKIKFVKDTKYKQYNDRMCSDKYSFTFTLQCLIDICDKRDTFCRFADINGDHKRPYYDQLKELNQILTDFLTAVETDDGNELILKGLKEKETKLKDELRIR